MSRRPSKIVLEKWLAKKERELHSLNVDAQRQWAAVPRRPDSYTGEPLAGSSAPFIPPYDNCSGPHDSPYFCAPRFFDVWVPPFDPPSNQYHPFESHGEWDNQTHTLTRAPSGSATLNGTDYSDLLTDFSNYIPESDIASRQAVWRKEITQTAESGHPETATLYLDVVLYWWTGGPPSTLAGNESYDIIAALHVYYFRDGFGHGVLPAFFGLFHQLYDHETPERESVQTELLPLMDFGTHVDETGGPAMRFWYGGRKTIDVMASSSYVSGRAILTPHD